MSLLSSEPCWHKTQDPSIYLIACVDENGHTVCVMLHLCTVFSQIQAQVPLIGLSWEGFDSLEVSYELTVRACMSDLGMLRFRTLHVGAKWS